MKRTKWVAAVLMGAALAIVAAAISRQRRRDGVLSPAQFERRAEPDPEALQAMVDGTRPRVGLDLEVLRSLHPDHYEPLVEYLTYIQVQRGESSSLVFVREKDIDSLAGMVNESRDEFLEKFQKLGVMLSMN